MAHLKHINPNVRTRYVLERERSKPEAEQTVFVMRPLTSLDHFEIYAKPGAAHALEQLRRALVNIENAKGPEGTVEFTVDADGFTSRALLERLELADMLELARARANSETITVDEAGKS